LGRGFQEYPGEARDQPTVGFGRSLLKKVRRRSGNSRPLMALVSWWLVVEWMVLAKWLDVWRELVSGCGWVFEVAQCVKRASCRVWMAGARWLDV